MIWQIALDFMKSKLAQISKAEKKAQKNRNLLFQVEYLLHGLLIVKIITGKVFCFLVIVLCYRKNKRKKLHVEMASSSSNIRAKPKSN